MIRKRGKRPRIFKRGSLTTVHALPASRSRRGLSVIALPSTHRAGPTLVEQLSAPVTTTRADVDVVVTEHGVADLRGLDDRERGRVLRDLWS